LFNLEDLNSELFKKLKRYLMCNEESNLQSCFKNLRADLKYVKSNKELFVDREYGSYEKANIKKNELIDLLKFKNVLGDDDLKLTGDQIWYFAHTNEIRLNKNFDKAFDGFLEKFLKDTYEEIVRYFFDFPTEQQFSHHIEFTYYDNGCFLKNHSDGTGTGRICACLIYLNEDYNFDDGGYLVLQNTEKVLPKIGNVAIIDLQSFDIPHMVTEVTGGIGRYACLNFIRKAEDIFK
jgi:hypothetical protein